jgi:hypothetical protein
VEFFAGTLNHFCQSILQVLMTLLALNQANANEVAAAHVYAANVLQAHAGNGESMSRF